MTSFLKEKSDCPIVKISLGKARGKALGKVKGGKTVYRYSSLPFAKPPVGDLRFEPPVSPDPWNGILDATAHSAAPVQDMDEDMNQFMPGLAENNLCNFDEDSLYLSVYTSNPSQAAKLPVLFWIYGGEFTMGGEDYYDARVIASLHDVVVVIPNYRVSVFGFLSLGKDTDYPGNMGLHDQVMALKWTKSHIKSFGGNPNKVTIFGESAGAMSVNYHVMSPLSKGLFHGAISHSGSFFCPGFPSNDLENPLMTLKEQLKIKETESAAVIKKLKSLPKDDIFNVVKVMQKEENNFAPVYDGKFFPKPISTLKKEPVVNNVPYIVGCNNTEGFGLMTATFPQNFNDGITKEDCSTFMQLVLNQYCQGMPDAGYELLSKEYEKGKKDNDPKKWSKVYGEILAHVFIVGPTIETLQKHVESKGKSFMYVMTQQPQFNHTGPETARKAEFCECDHADDILFTFGLPLMNSKMTFDVNFTENEKKLSREWIKYIANFATNGDPNIGVPVKVKWPEYKTKSKEHLNVQEPCSTGKNYGAKKHEFWQKVIEPMLPKPGQTKDN